jgi:hypothetical protein
MSDTSSPTPNMMDSINNFSNNNYTTNIQTTNIPTTNIHTTTNNNITAPLRERYEVAVKQITSLYKDMDDTMRSLEKREKDVEKREQEWAKTLAMMETHANNAKHKIILDVGLCISLFNLHCFSLSSLIKTCFYFFLPSFSLVLFHHKVGCLIG